MPVSQTDNIFMKNCDIKCKTYFNVLPDKSKYILSDFKFENLNIETEKDGFSSDFVENMVLKNIKIKIKET